MKIILDASAIMAVIAEEPEAATAVSLTMGQTIVSPSMVSIEIANALTKMMKKKVIDSNDKMIQVFQQFRRVHIKKDGNTYKLAPVAKRNMKAKSPFEDVSGIKLNITTQEIVEILHECRAGI